MQDGWRACSELFAPLLALEFPSTPDEENHYEANIDELKSQILSLMSNNGLAVEAAGGEEAAAA